MEKNKTKAGVFKFTAKNVPPITPNKINIPKDFMSLKSTASVSYTHLTLPTKRIV